VKRIGAHRHFWRPNSSGSIRIDQEIEQSPCELFPKQLWRLMQQNGFEGFVAFQAGQSEKETDFLIALAKQNGWVKGVVGWVDLQAQDIFDRLEWYRSFSILKGFRHLLHNESRRDLMLQPAFIRGIAALQQYGFSYDLLIDPDQLKYASKLVAFFPEQKFVLDLLAGPDQRDLDIVRWREDLWSLAENQHVYCKMSGMIPMAARNGSARANFLLYVTEIVKAFGMDRIMFGSDWPLRQAAVTYAAGAQLLHDYFSTFSREEQELFFVWNAVNFYNL
jgi:L-fuconolactonase